MMFIGVWSNSCQKNSEVENETCDRLASIFWIFKNSDKSLTKIAHVDLVHVGTIKLRVSVLKCVYN